MVDVSKGDSEFWGLGEMWERWMSGKRVLSLSLDGEAQR